MQYLEIKCSCEESFREILIAELAEIGFDSFLETETGFDAYLPEESFSEEAFEKIIKKYQSETPISFSKSKMPKVNWNEEWEKNYDPIIVEDQVYVRASFHPDRPEFPYQILINPKMSFGTGHHATTYLMILSQLEIEHRGKRVIDIGSGTGILAIMAHFLGAAEIEAFDIDEWCVENGNENFQLNGMDGIKMGFGTVRQVKPTGLYDIVLANINKNVLLDEMSVYAELLKPEGTLLLSGFYTEDIPDLLQETGKFGLQKIKESERNNWAVLVLKRK